MNGSLPGPTEEASSRTWILVCAVVVGVGVVAGGLTALFLFLGVPGGKPASDIVQIDESRASAAGGTPRAAAMNDYSASNVVSVLLGQEETEDGIRHLAEEPDGRTTIETVDGVPCRYLNRRPQQKGNGFLYFAIHPDFKREELKTARIEIEYYAATPGFLRIQYDGMEGDAHKRYKTAVPIDEQPVTLGAGARFVQFEGTSAWRTASFQVTEGVFSNSENGGADFRMEVIPPELYVRRVSVTREAVKPQPVQ